MHSPDLIFTIAGGLSAALVFGYITQRIGLSPIVGYLLAGTLVGPHTPGFVANTTLAQQLAEIGVILLMFGVGLQFHFEELLAVRRIAIPGALAQSGVSTILGTALALSFGWHWSSGLIFGIALSVASTVVLIRVLSDNNDLHTQAGHIAVGWLVVEDILTVLALVLLPALFGGASGGSLPVSLALTLVKVAVLVGLTAVFGTRVIPRVLDYIAATRSRELFTLSVLVIALGIAVVSSEVFNVSMALGAFLAGMIVGRSEYSLRAASEALPMRDAFAVLFFVSVGMLLDVHAIADVAPLVLGALAVVLIGKPLVAFILVWTLRYPLRTVLTIAVALSQIGEFSFILATLGHDLGILSTTATNTLVATAIVSIVLNPVAYRTIGPIERWLRKYPALYGILNRASNHSEVATKGPATATHPKYRAIVIGYGPTGRTVARQLQSHGVVPTVIELNVDMVRALRSEGIDAIYGDATRIDTIEAAGAATAAHAILSSAGMSNSAEVIRMVRTINPQIRVLARTSYLREVAELRAAGATHVYSGEGEIALAFVENILNTLGATPEQIDRERARVHADLVASHDFRPESVTS